MTPRWTRDDPAVQRALRQLEQELSSPAMGKAFDAYDNYMEERASMATGWDDNDAGEL